MTWFRRKPKYEQINDAVECKPLTGIEKHWEEVEREEYRARYAAQNERREFVLKEISRLTKEIEPVTRQIEKLRTELDPMRMMMQQQWAMQSQLGSMLGGGRYPTLLELVGL